MIKILSAVVILGLAFLFIMGMEEDKQPKASVPEAATETPPGPRVDDSADPVVVTEGNLTLDLSNQRLTNVPQYIFDRTHIKELDLSYNNLTGSLPAEVRHLQNLIVLNLSNNQFTGLPAEVGQLKNLEILNLSNNQLTGLPYELGNLKKLRVLDLRGNNYTNADLETIRKGLSPTVQILVD